MTLFFTFVVLAFSLAVALTAISLFLQPYFYNDPARHLPVRGLCAGVFVSAFLSIWVLINLSASSPDRYGTLLEFNPTTLKTYTEFVAVRRDQHGNETRATLRKNRSRFTEVGNPDARFALTTSDYLVSGIEIKLGEETVHFDAELFTPDEAKPGQMRPWLPGEPATEIKFRSGTGARVFREAGGQRYLECSWAGDPSPVYEPSTAAFWGALALNFGHYLVWVIALWPILRFSLGHALGMALAAWLAAMLLGMPLLTNLNIPKARTTPAAIQKAA